MTSPLLIVSGVVLVATVVMLGSSNRTLRKAVEEEREVVSRRVAEKESLLSDTRNQVGELSKRLQQVDGEKKTLQTAKQDIEKQLNDLKAKQQADLDAKAQEVKAAQQQLEEAKAKVTSLETQLNSTLTAKEQEAAKAKAEAEAKAKAEAEKAKKEAEAKAAEEAKKAATAKKGA